MREVDDSEPETVHERCIVSFVGEKNEIVAVTNVYRYLHTQYSLVLNTDECVY